MPRSVKDSDDDGEPKIVGRRTRAALGTLVTDSPVRRSNRNKQSTKQNNSSPDELTIETTSTRSFRTRSDTADANTLDALKRLRSNKIFGDGDSDTLLETPSKKMSRRSIATAITSDTPKTNIRPKRLTRAGSESKSTPLRTTRKTRSSSVDPESTIVEPIENIQSRITNTPIKMKRRSIMLSSSQSTVIKEEKTPYVELEKMLIEVNEKSTDTIVKNESSPSKVLESFQKNKNIDKIEEEKDSSSAEGPIDDSNENNRTRINETSQDDDNKLLSDKMNTPKKDEYSVVADINDIAITKDVSKDSSNNLDDISKEIISKDDENVLNVSNDKDIELNTSNKENECSNINNTMSEQNKNLINLESSIKDISNDLTMEENKIIIKDIENNDNIKLDSYSLKESSVSLLDCNNTLLNNSNVNINEDNNLMIENKRLSITNVKEISFNEEKQEISNTSDEKKNDSNMKILNESNEVLANEENVILKEQSDINDDDDKNQIHKTFIKEEQSLNVLTKKEIHLNDTNNKDDNKDKENVSTDSVLILGDTSENEDNRNNDVDPIETTNVENDEKESDKTVETILTSKNSNVTEINYCPVNDNQDNMFFGSNESSIALEVSNDSIKYPINDADSTKSSNKLQSSELNKSNLEKIDDSIVTESNELQEDNLSDKEKESMIKSSSNTPKISKKTSTIESNILKSKEKNKKDIKKIDDTDNDDDDDDDDNVSKIKELFKDISADEWKEKSKNINIKTQNNSTNSSSTVKLETDSETDCDLLLVDKKAWLAAEKLKAIKDTEIFDYDSDDTIILKSKLDYLNDKLNNKNKKEIKSKDSSQDNDNNSDVKDITDKFHGTIKKLKQNEQDNLVVVNKSLNKSNDKDDLNVSSSKSTSKKEKSRKSSSLCNVSKNELSKSLEKQFKDEEEKEEIEEKEKEEQKEISENSETKVTIDVNKTEVYLSQSNLTQSSSDKKKKKSSSLSSSLNSSFNSSINKSNKLKSKKRNRLNISSSEEEKNDGNSSENNKEKIIQLKTNNDKKKINPNYSTIVHIGSDSDTCNESTDSSNTDVRNKTPRIPRFLFKQKNDKEENNDDDKEEDNNDDDDDDDDDKGSDDNFSVEGQFSDISIDTDIKKEYNLDGKTDTKFSDDDIPGDECRASESEFSDPDDNGSDLADFVVDDDEVEEEDEDESEGEGNKGVDEDDDDDEDEDDEEDEDKEIEVEDIDKDEDDDEDSEKEKENDDEEEIDIEQAKMKNIIKEGNRSTTISCEEEDNDINDEKINKLSSNKKMNISDSKIKNKKSPKVTKITKELNYSESDDDTILSDAILDINNSGKQKSKEKEQLNENTESLQETRIDVITKKNKESNISLTCSTPKPDVITKQQLKQNTSKNDKKSNDKISTNEEQDKIQTKDSSGDSSELNQSTSINSKTSTKKCSILSNSPANYAELFKDKTLSKVLLSKKGSHLNKTVSPSNETPKTKFLKKEKLNDSCPNIKVGEIENISKITTDNKDQKKDVTEEEDDKNSRIIVTEEENVVVTEQTESKSSVSVKRKRSVETIDSDDQIGSFNKLKKNKISTKLDKLTVSSDNEKENSESGVKIDTEKKKRKRKRNKKNKNSNNELKMENIIPTVTIKQDINKDEEMEKTIYDNEIKNKKKTKKNIQLKDNNDDDKLINVKENDPIYYEIENITNKKKKKITSEPSTSQIKEKSKKPLQKITIKDTNTEVSDDKSSSIQFSALKSKALEATKRAIDDINANKNKNKKKDMKIKNTDQIIAKACKRGIKRLPADVIENLSDVPMNPFKKQKILKNRTTTTEYGFTEGYVTKKRKIPSDNGGTTDFDIVNLRKAKNKLKSAAVSFRNKMINRNPRFPATSSYIMYLHKKNASK